MSTKADMGKMLAEIAELEKAIAEAKAARGLFTMTIVNDPELGLEDFVIKDLDQSKCYEIGPAAQPGGD
jgi:hypothetical protein